MDIYSISITNEALTDMEKIYNYISNELSSPSAALNQYNRISEAIYSLTVFPNKFVLLDIEPEHTWGMRRMVVDNYLVFYIVENDMVIVTDVLFGKSNYHDVLLERHLK